VSDADSDQALMLRYQAGDAAAFDALYARHRAPLYRYLARQVTPRDLADELFQDVWMKLIAARLSWQPRAQFSTWLYTLAHNRLIDHWRKQGTQAQVIDTDAEERALAAVGSRLDEPLVTTESAALRGALNDAIGALPTEQRDAFLLSAEGDLSVTQIAEVTGAGHEAAKSRLRYAIRKLRSALGAYA
jgi:RNA polymerase sigma factor (sigma-70 family)